MLLTLNGTPARFAVRTESLAALLDDARAACPADQLIVSISINGELLGEETLQARLDRPVAEDDQIDLDTDVRVAVVAEALRAVANEIGAAAEDQRWAAAQIDQGRTANGLAPLEQFTQLMQMGSNALQQSSDLLGRDLTTFDVDGAPVAQRLEDLQNQLRELRAALLARDMVALGDLLHDELPRLSEAWAEILGGLADGVLAERPDPAAC